MKKLFLSCAVLLLAGGLPAAQAATFNVVTIWHEPDTQPKNSIFTGTFDFDEITHAVTNLQGTLTESMTGAFPMPADDPGQPYYDMTLVPLGHQLFSAHDAARGGTLVATFAKTITDTFMGHGWTPQDGVDIGGIFDGGPKMSNYAASIQNAYALIFVPDHLSTASTAGNPLTLFWNETTGTGSAGLAAAAYADCTPDGMMGAVCMTATSAWVYGATGTMSGHPLMQEITLATPAAVPAPAAGATLMTGLGLLAGIARRNRRQRA